MSTGDANRKRSAQELFAPLPKHYDRVAAVLSFGQDPRWRATIVEQIAAQPGQRVLDVATGTGLVAEALVRRWGCAVVGVDQSPQMLGAARSRLRHDLTLAGHVTLMEAEAERLPFQDGEFDHLTFTYLLRYVEDPQATMRELARVVRPGGRIASLEFGVPGTQPWRALWDLYTHVGLPGLGRLVSREWSQTGSFLARSIPDFYARHTVSDVAEMWRKAGIDAVSARAMSLGGGLVMWGSRSSDEPERPPGEGMGEASPAGPGDRRESEPLAPASPPRRAGAGRGS